MYFSPQVVTVWQRTLDPPLIECSRAPLDGEVAALTAALLVLVQDQLLEFLLLVTDAEVRLDGHLDLLLSDLGGGAGYGAVRLSANTWSARIVSRYLLHGGQGGGVLFFKRQ